MIVAAVFMAIPSVLVSLNNAHAVSVFGTVSVVVGYSLMAAFAAFAAWRAWKCGTGLEARTWRHVFIGLALWTCGGLMYIIYVATGGDPLAPAAWSQAGYLAAYPFWYMALWGLRQPVLATSRSRQLEIVTIEFTVLLIFSVVVGSVLWNSAWPPSQNIAQLVPAIMDILLLATFYAAVRRSRWSATTALTWLGYAFAVLAASDILLSYSVAQGLIEIGSVASTGYVIAMSLVVIASRRPLRLAEVQNRVRGTTGIVAVGGLTLAGVAMIVAPTALRPIVLLGGGLLSWRTLAILNERDNSDIDVLTGFLDLRAFERHLGGVIQLSTIERPALLVVVDIAGFGAWNARNGYNAGDSLLASVAKALEGAGPDATVWGRLKGDRFAVTTISHGEVEDRALAEQLRAASAAKAAPLSVRSAVVQLPSDAHSAPEALDAADEALRAGAESGRHVVAYSGGGMDGLIPTPGNASLAGRRQRIQELIAAHDAITVFLQPIVRLEDLTISGFEALSRFNAEPQLGPDQWIAEATRLGLGEDLEVDCARRAWMRRGEIPRPVHLAINVSPDVIMSELFAETFRRLDLDGVVFEVTEHGQVTDYAGLAAKLASLRERGARIAIDDTGAGHASLNHLIELNPDFIKLDRKLVTGLDSDRGKNALVRNMLGLADDLGAKLVAEGIETEAELWALRQLGVPLGQGYFLGRPTPSAETHLEHLELAGTVARVPIRQYRA